MDGINLPAITSLYKRLQASQQLLTSPEGCVRLKAERNRQHELTLSRKTFKPAVFILNTMADDPTQSGKALSPAAKRSGRRMTTTGWPFEKQGQMLATSADEGSWSVGKKLADDLRRYHQCHDLVLGEIADDIK